MVVHGDTTFWYGIISLPLLEDQGVDASNGLSGGGGGGSSSLSRTNPVLEAKKAATYHQLVSAMQQEGKMMELLRVELPEFRVFHSFHIDHAASFHILSPHHPILFHDIPLSWSGWLGWNARFAHYHFRYHYEC